MRFVCAFDFLLVCVALPGCDSGIARSLRQPIYVPKTKNFITLAGLRLEDTVLTWNNTATKIDHHQSSRLIGTETFGCGSVIVEGEDFIAENITFENSSPQDTLYLHYGKQYLKDCYIEGILPYN